MTRPVAESAATRPRFSLVVPVYNVARYLDDFLSSLERQSHGLDRVETILVDDGATDGSGARCDAFAARHPTVRVVHKPNGGLSSARNAGMAEATGEWIGFPDPDDILSDDYLERIAAFLDDHAAEQPVMLMTRVLMRLDAEGGRLADTSSLRHKFAQGDRVVDLREHPDHFQLQAASTFLRLDLLREHGLVFDGRIRPNFEDSHLISRALLRAPAPIAGAVASAVYQYRKRDDASSLIDRSWGDPRKYSDIPRHGYLPLAEEAERLTGGIPNWLQQLLVAEIGLYLYKQDKGEAPAGRVEQAALDEFHAAAGAVLARLDPDEIAANRSYPFSNDARFVLAHGYRPEPAHGAPKTGRHDVHTGLVELGYRYTGPAPAEELLVHGQPSPPVHGKQRAAEYFGRTLVREHIMWVPGGAAVELRLDGKPALAVEAEALARHAARIERGRPAWLRLLLRLRPAGAWALLDAVDRAGGEAERFARWLAAEHPGIPVRFVLDRRSPDWARLRRDGFRLVRYGRLRWRALMLTASVVVSSRAERRIAVPLDEKRYGRSRWPAVLLQLDAERVVLPRHNAPAFSLVAVSTREAFAALAPDGSPSRFTDKELLLVEDGDWGRVHAAISALIGR